MVTPRRPPYRPPSGPEASNSNQGRNWLIGLGGFVLLVYMLTRCSGDTSSTDAQAAMNLANIEMSNSIAAQDPPPVEPLSPAGVSRGDTHYRTAFAAEGFAGAMVYSQNCYDALSREFSWRKLDQCGAFDMLAVRSADGTADIPPGEGDYFQSEAAAGRYLAAATGAGAPAEQADQRLSQLQARAVRLRLPTLPQAQADHDDGNLDETVNAALDEPVEEIEGQ